MWWYVAIIGNILLVGGIAARQIYLWKHRHIGFGMMLDYKEIWGNVQISSRLSDSPAGRAGVPIGCRLVSYNGISMKFPSKDEFAKKWNEIKPKKVGDVAHIQLEFYNEKGHQFLRFKLVAEKIQGPIPVHDFGPIDSDDAFDHGLAIDRKTNQFIQTRKLSDSAIRKSLRP